MTLLLCVLLSMSIKLTRKYVGHSPFANVHVRIIKFNLQKFDYSACFVVFLVKLCIGCAVVLTMSRCDQDNFLNPSDAVRIFVENSC